MVLLCEGIHKGWLARVQVHNTLLYYHKNGSISRSRSWLKVVPWLKTVLHCRAIKLERWQGENKDSYTKGEVREEVRKNRMLQIGGRLQWELLLEVADVSEWRDMITWQPHIFYKTNENMYAPLGGPSIFSSKELIYKRANWWFVLTDWTLSKPLSRSDKLLKHSIKCFIFSVHTVKSCEIFLFTFPKLLIKK